MLSASALLDHRVSHKPFIFRRFKPKFLKPIMSSCYAHCLNLAVVKSCQLPIVRNTIDTVKDVSYAFHYSLKRTGRFKTMEILKGKFQLHSISITTSP
jgi:hypothetical protein